MLRSVENNCSRCCCDKKGAGKPALLGSGEINHIGPGEKSQYRPDENRQSRVASPPAVLFTRPVVGQPVSR